MNKKQNNYIGNNLKKLRINLEMSQSEIARRAGVTSSAISQLEKGNRKPSLQMLQKLAKVFNILPADLDCFEIKKIPEQESFYMKFRKIEELPKRDQKLLLQIINRLIKTLE